MSESAPTLLPPRIEGRLLPRAYLDEVLPDTDDWRAVPDAELDSLAARLVRLVDAIAARATPRRTRRKPKFLCS